MASRRYAVLGFGLIVAGFAFGSVVDTFQMLQIDNILAAISFGVALTFAGWLLIIAFLARQGKKHLSAKAEHAKETILKNIEPFLVNPQANKEEPESMKLRCVIGLSKSLPDIDQIVLKKVEATIGLIQTAGNIDAIQNALSQLKRDLA